MDGVKLLTIGEFARLARLSQKALRLYDELGLLRPFRVDEWSGYRYYAPSQLERARLVAWLRRLGMPLAQIGAVLDAPPAEAAALVAAFLRVTEADFAERQRLAQFLISYLREGATAMPDSLSASSPCRRSAPLAIRYAAASDSGLIRERNQDVGYAGPAAARRRRRVRARRRPGERRGHRRAAPPGSGPGGASRAAVVPADLLNVLSDALSAASDSVRSISESDPELRGQRVDADRDAAVRLPARAGAHRRLARLPVPRRRPVPGHPRPLGSPISISVAIARDRMRAVSSTCPRRIPARNSKHAIGGETGNEALPPFTCTKRSRRT